MSKYLIAIDDGHGMETAGKRTPKLADGSIMRENEFNRAVKRYLDTELKRCGFRTILVAAGDTDTPLETRANIANHAKADAYISIHANAYDGTFEGANPEGIETYYFSNSAKGKELATEVHSQLILGTRQVSRGIKPNTFYVLRKTKMPAILIEAGFMDNPREAELLRSDIFRKEVAMEIAIGICSYFEVPYVLEKEIVEKPINKPVPVVPKKTIQDRTIIALQKIIGARADGIPGPITLSKCPTLRRGQRSDVVAWLQAKLGIKADGIFGINTLNAVYKFQGERGLVKDGVFGQKSWRKMLGL